MTTRPSANSRPSVVGIGTGTGSPSRSRCWRSSVSHARSASLRPPRRPTARCRLTRTLHTSLATPLATPPPSGSMRATSSPHWSSVSHPTGHIFAEFLTSLTCEARHEPLDASRRRITIVPPPLLRAEPDRGSGRWPPRGLGILYSGLCTPVSFLCVRQVAPDSGGPANGRPTRDHQRAERYRVVPLTN